MNYEKHYYSLIFTRKLLNRKKEKTVYYEKHHILPKSCGGTNEEENLVFLTFKEHFIAHVLLTKMYEGELKRKMCYALWRMSNISKNHKRILSSSQYKICKEAERKAKENHIVTEITRKKISVGNTGKKRTIEMNLANSLARRGKTHLTSEETKKKISNSNKGKTRTAEMNLANSLRNLGNIQSEETKKKRSDKLIGKSRPQEVINKIRKNNPLRKEVICSNGIIYDSVNDAVRQLNLSQANVSAICNGRRKSTMGLAFSFLNKEQKQ
jgi:hypothetical protein